MASFSARYVFLPALVGLALGALYLLYSAPSEPVVNTGYSAAVSKAAPSVVNIYTSKVIEQRVSPICQLPRFRDLCEMYKGNGRRMQSSLGSGVVISADGYILTNNHVIADADEILVAFMDGHTETAQVVGADPETDLAVIRVPGDQHTPITVGDSDAVSVGDIALAIGNPFGFGQTVSMGIISAKGRAGISASPYDDFIQTDAAINPGNSGGALIDTQGHLIGINTLIFSRSGGSEGIGFAIPSHLAGSILEQIARNGQVVRGWLGVELENVPATGAVGLRVLSVVRGGPAHMAGIRSGDVLTAINDTPAINSRVITQAISEVVPGEKLAADVLRPSAGQQVQTLELTAGQRPAPVP